MSNSIVDLRFFYFIKNHYIGLPVTLRRKFIICLGPQNHHQKPNNLHVHMIQVDEIYMIICTLGCAIRLPSQIGCLFTHANYLGQYQIAKKFKFDFLSV